MKTGFIGAGAYATCPVDGCDWKLNTDQPPSQRYEVRQASSEGVSEAISRAAVGRAQEIEQVLRDHLVSHDVLDYLRTIHRLNVKLAPTSPLDS